MIIPFETGIPSLLKEKGFDENCFASFNKDGSVIHYDYPSKNSYFKDCISAPDYDQVIDWLENNHNIILSSIFDCQSRRLKWDLDVYNQSNLFYVNRFKTRYDALNEGIKEALKLIKNMAIEIKINEPQPLPCPKCKAKEGFQYSDYIAVHYTSHHSVDGKYEGGSYSDGCKNINYGKSTYCCNCGTKLPFKLNRN